MSLKVCHISTVHPTFDGRIFHKECVSLAKAGFDVSLVVTHDKKETVDGVHIIPLPPTKNRLHRLFIKSHFAFYRTLKTKAKIVHFHDPELIGLGIMFKILGKKVIYDSHENVSSQIESKSWLGNKWTRKLIKSIYRNIEKFAILFFDSVISVTPEIVDYLSPKKGVLLRNYPIISMIDNVLKEKINTPRTTLIYVGGLTKIRGIKEICEAVNLQDDAVELLLLGVWESESFKQECLSVSNKITYCGVKPLAEVYPLIHQADIGFVTLYPEKNYLNSLPIKAFEYMTCGIPMIMSNFPYWEKTFEGIAEFIDPMDVNQISESVTKLIKEEGLRKEMGTKGRQMAQEKFSWEEESKKLIELYKKLENE